jgi:hypothetical protein
VTWKSAGFDFGYKIFLTCSEGFELKKMSQQKLSTSIANLPAKCQLKAYSFLFIVMWGIPVVAERNRLPWV